MLYKASKLLGRYYNQNYNQKIHLTYGCIFFEATNSFFFKTRFSLIIYLLQARSISVPKEANQIFLPAVAVNAYLTKLQKCNFNMFDKSLHLGNATLPFSLYYNRFLNKF